MHQAHLLLIMKDDVNDIICFLSWAIIVMLNSIYSCIT